MSTEDIPETPSVENTFRQDQLEEVREDLNEAFGQAIENLERGRVLTEDDIKEMRGALDVARVTVEEIADETPGVAKLPELWDILDEDDREKYGKRLAAAREEQES